MKNRSKYLLKRIDWILTLLFEYVIILTAFIGYILFVVSYALNDNSYPAECVEFYKIEK
jgi:hypothetical protein